ncbi:hypothetical protein BKA93DRAFT_829629 [Sparassis latifolia]|uniref:Uncharacterized protein n=1 Tax=Sparassis crispa TaxID=139825 RepID=A0A401GDP1_9APHY|nr:hypothetical protein SCP_0300230 [Sparassis crispa]GBE80308.1 hypothetical protein SCP_0300230 [Sparassis crispa]
MENTEFIIGQLGLVGWQSCSLSGFIAMSPSRVVVFTPTSARVPCIHCRQSQTLLRHYVWAEHVSLWLLYNALQRPDDLILANVGLTEIQLIVQWPAYEAQRLVSVNLPVSRWTLATCIANHYKQFFEDTTKKELAGPFATGRE